MGQEFPGPGSSAFHLRFSVSLHSAGSDSLSVLTPEPLGPRNLAQSAALIAGIEITPATANASTQDHLQPKCMIMPPEQGIDGDLEL
jgi:hypothetical protein